MIGERGEKRLVVALFEEICCERLATVFDFVSTQPVLLVAELRVEQMQLLSQQRVVGTETDLVLGFDGARFRFDVDVSDQLLGKPLDGVLDR